MESSAASSAGSAAQGNGQPRVLLVMGVSSSGKSTVGEALAKAWNAPFLDADAWHPPANVEKMRAGVALSDADRWPWLSAYADALDGALTGAGGVVGACSALRRTYRDHLVARLGEPVALVYLHGTRELISQRIRRRHHTYMPGSLLDSQLATLEPPMADEVALTVDIDQRVEAIVAQVLRHFPRP